MRSSRTGLWLCLIVSLLLVGCGKKEEEAVAPAPGTSIPLPPPPAPEASSPATAASAAVEEPTTSPHITPPSSGPNHGPAPAAVTPRQAADQALAQLEKANVAFKAPAAMRQNDTAMVELRLSLHREVAELTRELHGTSTDQTDGGGVRVSRRVEALLTASKADFEITPVSATEQLLGTDEDVAWSWAIKPLDGGSKSLHLTLNSILTVDGAMTRKTVRSFDKFIEVKVSTLEVLKAFVAKNWQWLWATLLVPLAGWLWRRLRKSPQGAQA